MNNPTFTFTSMSKKDRYQNQYQELLDLFNPSSVDSTPSSSESSSGLSTPIASPSITDHAQNDHSKSPLKKRAKPVASGVQSPQLESPSKNSTSSFPKTNSTKKGSPSQSYQSEKKSKISQKTRSPLDLKPHESRLIPLPTSSSYSTLSKAISNFKINPELIRKSHRFIVQLDQKESYQFYGPNTSELDQGGLFIPTGLMINVGDPVLVQIKSSKSPSFILKGIVHWVKEPNKGLKGKPSRDGGIGVHFNPFPNAAKKILEAHIDPQQMLFYLD